jgi:hypothetical protein
MNKKDLPVVVTQDTSARRSYRIEAPDQYAAKYLALFLMDHGIYFFFLGSLLGSFQPEICFNVPRSECDAIEEFLASIPTARPSSDEFLAAHLYADADAGRLDLAQSQNAVAQVTGHGDTQYLADLWNAFAPVGKVDVGVIPPAPIPALPESTSLDELKLPVTDAA